MVPPKTRRPKCGPTDLRTPPPPPPLPPSPNGQHGVRSVGPPRGLKLASPSHPVQPAPSFQVFVSCLDRTPRTVVIECGPHTTLRGLKAALYGKVKNSFVSERLFQHYLHLSRRGPDGGPVVPFDANVLEGKLLADLDIGPDAVLRAEMRDPAAGARFGASASSSSSSSSSSAAAAAFAAEIVVHIPSTPGVRAAHCADAASVVARVADVRRLPTAPRQFMAAVMAAGRWAGLDRYAGALVLEQVLSPGRQQQTQKKKHGQEKQPQQPPPLPVPGEGYESWRPVWERTRVSVIWRGQPLMDGRLSKEADCEQIHRDSVLALFEEVAAANEKLAAGQVVRHELFIVGADGLGKCCAMFAEPTWPRTMNMLSNPKRQEEMVELACRAVVCPAQCLDQVFQRLRGRAFLAPGPQDAAHSLSSRPPPCLLYDAFGTLVEKLEKPGALAVLRRLVDFRCPHQPASSSMCACPLQKPGFFLRKTTTCAFVRRLILDQFLYNKLSFTAYDLKLAGAGATPCLVRAVLDGVQELGEHLRQRSTCGAAATFSSNAAAVLGRLRERGADKVLWSTTVWALLRFPLLFAPCARPLRPSHLLCKALEEEEDEEDEHWAPSPTASLLNALLDRSRHKLLVPSAGGSSSGVPAKKPRPDPLPAAAPSPPLPRKITALVALLEQGVAALTAPREADAPSSSDNDTVVEAVAGGIAHYITAMLLPSSSATLLVPVPLVALQELGRAVVGYLQPPQPHPSPLSSEVQNELIRLLAALLALEPAAAPAVNPPPSSWQLVEHVSQAITAAGDRLASLQPMTLLPATPPDDYGRASDALTALLRAAWLTDPWLCDDDDGEEKEKEPDDAYYYVARRFLRHARAAVLDPTCRGRPGSLDVGFLLLAATWRVVPRLLRVFGPALQSPDDLPRAGSPRYGVKHAGIVSLLFALAHHTPLHLPPPPLRGDGGDEAMDGTVMGVQAADLRGLATDYAAFVGALQESLGGVWARAVAGCWNSELGKWGAFSLGHAQVFAEAQPGRRALWKGLLQRTGVGLPPELETWWADWSWRDSVVALEVRERLLREEIAMLSQRTYDAWREGRDEDEDDENEEYDDVEEQAYVLFKLEVERANPLGRTFTRLVGTSTAQEVRGRRLTAVFVDEPAYGPGVRREAVEVLWDALAQPGYCLLEGFQEGRIFYPSPLSAVANPELWKHYFVFMGRLLGFALRERLLVLLPLPTVLFKLLSSSSSVADPGVGLEDLRELDPEMHRRLARMLLPAGERMEDSSVDDWGLTFSLRVEAGAGGAGGLNKTFELIPSGNDVEVTEANRLDYVQAFVETRLRTAVQEQLAAARDGLLDVLPLSAVQALSPSELRAAICGAGQEADPLALHPDRWAEHIELEGYRSDSPQILWLWEFLGAASLETRARLLRFITGSSRLPAPDGFAALDPGVNILSVGLGADDDDDDPQTFRLPVAHTCSRSLDLPAYPSKEILFERLTLALAYVDVEFGLA